MSINLHATTNLTHDSNKSDEKLTPEILAAAIKLASLSTDHQEKQTPNTKNAAIKLAKYPLNHDEQQRNLTPESLALALKFATRVSQSEPLYKEISGDQMQAAITISQGNQSDESSTSDIFANAMKLMNK